MKQAVHALFGLVLLFSLASCGKEISTEASNNPNVKGTIKMKIDGTQWIALKVASATIKDGFITITGVSNDNKSLIIELVDNGPATYTLDQQSGDYAAVADSKEAGSVAYATDEGQDNDDAGGEVIISKIDQTNKKISGTFSFKVYRDSDNKQLVITEGIIEDLRYGTDEPTNPGGGNVTQTFSVKVDGTATTFSTLAAVKQSTTIMITATQMAGGLIKSVVFWLPDDIAVGSYDFGTSNDYLGAYSTIPTTGGVATSYEAESGKITITEHNTTTKVIKGTFFFDGKDDQAGGTVKLTEGAFTIKY